MVATMRRLLAGALLMATACSGCSSSQEPAPRLSRAAEQIEFPKPPPPKPPPPPPTVDEVSQSGCTTKVVAGLSQQIIAEGNCLSPGAFVALPELPNVTLDEAVFPYLAEPARDALVNAVHEAKSEKLAINSMLRTVAQQYLLFRWWKAGRCGITLAALPGASNHQSGLALDVDDPEKWKRRLGKHGFRWLGKRDRWHFDFVGKGKTQRPPPAAAGSLDVEAFQRLWNRNHPDEEPLAEDGDFDAATEAALRGSPAGGFPIGATCKP
jgi:hypothetical protein